MLKYIAFGAGIALSALSYTTANAADLAGAPDQNYCKEWKLLPFEQRNCAIGVQSGGSNTRHAPGTISKAPPSPPSDPGCGDGGDKDHDDRHHEHDGSRRGGGGQDSRGPGGSPNGSKNAGH